MCKQIRDKSEYYFGTKDVIGKSYALALPDAQVFSVQVNPWAKHWTGHLQNASSCRKVTPWGHLFRIQGLRPCLCPTALRKNPTLQVCLRHQTYHMIADNMSAAHCTYLIWHELGHGLIPSVSYSCCKPFHSVLHCNASSPYATHP